MSAFNIGSGLWSDPKVHLALQDDESSDSIDLEEVGENAQEELSAVDVDYHKDDIRYAFAGENTSEDSSEESSEEGSEAGYLASSDDDSEDENEETDSRDFVGTKGMNVVASRLTMRSTLQFSRSSNHKECVQRLKNLRAQLRHIPELCQVILDCCLKRRRYERFFGWTAVGLCSVEEECIDVFCDMFARTYETCHTLGNDKREICAKFFAALLHRDAILWDVLSTLKLGTETSLSSRSYIKTIFIELTELSAALRERVEDPDLQVAFAALLPRDTVENMKYAIEFFDSIRLLVLPDDLKDHLKSVLRRSNRIKRRRQPRRSVKTSSSAWR